MDWLDSTQGACAHDRKLRCRNGLFLGCFTVTIENARAKIELINFYTVLRGPLSRKFLVAFWVGSILLSSHRYNTSAIDSRRPNPEGKLPIFLAQEMRTENWRPRLGQQLSKSKYSKLSGFDEDSFSILQRGQSSQLEENFDWICDSTLRCGQPANVCNGGLHACLRS